MEQGLVWNVTKSRDVRTVCMAFILHSSESHCQRAAEAQLESQTMNKANQMRKVIARSDPWLEEYQEEDDVSAAR